MLRRRVKNFVWGTIFAPHWAYVYIQTDSTGSATATHTPSLPMSRESREMTSRATLDLGLQMTASNESDEALDAEIAVPWRHTEGVGMAVAFIYVSWWYGYIYIYGNPLCISKLPLKWWGIIKGLSRSSTTAWLSYWWFTCEWMPYPACFTWSYH